MPKPRKKKSKGRITLAKKPESISERTVLDRKRAGVAQRLARRNVLISRNQSNLKAGAPRLTKGVGSGPARSLRDRTVAGIKRSVQAETGALNKTLRNQKAGQAARKPGASDPAGRLMAARGRARTRREAARVAKEQASRVTRRNPKRSRADVVDNVSSKALRDFVGKSAKRALRRVNRTSTRLGSPPRSAVDSFDTGPRRKRKKKK